MDGSVWMGALSLAVVVGGAFFLQQRVASSSKQRDALALKQRRLQLLKEEQEKRKLEEAANNGSEDDARLICYFGSQTGTAEGFAKAVAGQAKKFGFASKVVDLDDFESLEDSLGKSADKQIHIFLVSTYGEGEPSDNAMFFYNALKTQGENKLDFPFRFTVFGLGNSQYEHFNQFGRFVDQALERIGGERVYAYGEGDDDGTLQDDFAAWMEDLHSELALKQGLELPNQDEAPVLESPVFTQDFQWIGAQSDLPDGGRFVASRRKRPASGTKMDFATKAYYKTEAFPIKAIRELKRGDNVDAEENSTLHIELLLPDSLEGYGTAHNLSIMPENAPDQVLLIAKQFGWTEKLDDWFSLRTCKQEPQVDIALFPTPCTLRCALASCVDLSALPSKLLVEKLAYFCKDSGEQRQLLRLASRASKKEFHSLIVAPRLRLFEFLQKFPSLQFDTPGQFLELCPRMMPRDYTIASSNKVFPREIHLIVSMVCSPLPDGRGKYLGVCTSALRARTMPVYAFLKPSGFVLPVQPKTPLLLIGPGTGVAPMRALLQERKWQKEQNMRVGEAALFFGCRTRTEDFYYEEEWAALQEAKVLTRLHCAFSREQAHAKVYVQDLLVKEGEWVWDWIFELGAHIYVCGSTSMGKDVSLALHGIAARHGKMTEAQTKEYFAVLSAKGKYIQELWS